MQLSRARFLSSALTIYHGAYDVSVANNISSLAATLGAVQNRLQYTQANLEVYSQNLASAVSGIVDVNMATEMTNFTKQQVLQQAGVAILAQANQLPDAVLKLIG